MKPNKVNHLPVRACAALALTLTFSSSMAATTSWDATADFSTAASSAVNGVWSYGTTGTSLSGGFAAFDARHIQPEFNYWTSGTGNLIGKAGPNDVASGSVRVPADTLILHPGQGGEYSALRYTAPTTGVYTINAAFWGDDFMGPTTTDVHVRTQGADVFSGFVNSYGADHGDAWSGIVHLAAGQSVDFAVGFGQNQNWGFDSTGLSATISEVPAVPEPTNIAMLLAGLGLVALARRRKA